MSENQIPKGSPAADKLSRESVHRFHPKTDHRYDNIPLTPQLRAQWMRDQIQRDIEFFEAKQTDWLGLQANEVWKDSRNPEAIRAKISASLALLNDILFRLRRMLTKKQPWNRGELKADKNGNTSPVTPDFSRSSIGLDPADATVRRRATSASHPGHQTSPATAQQNPRGNPWNQARDRHPQSVLA